MIAWYDRCKGEHVKGLPEQVLSGRYIALDTCVFNGHTEIHPGDFLLNDGTAKFHVESQVGSFHQDDKSEQLKTELEIIESAILAYKEAIDSGRTSSFLMPDKLLARFELTKFETLVFDVLKKGHLQEIARRPRIELIYEEHLLPISRAKKIAASANLHLASHSECWQTRTLTGVIPKKVLALESEDQLNIYENRVYVKLIEYIESYLIKRILEVKKLEEIFKRAVSFQNAEGIHFELRESIFTLWGEGFSNDTQADEGAENGNVTIAVLTKMLKKIRTLQQSKIYQALCHRIRVPLKLNMTNVLSHDQHYRYVARLWNSWLDTQNLNKLDPEQVLLRNKELAKGYSQYCSDLVKRTLTELGFKELTPNRFKRNGNPTIYLDHTAESEIVLKTSKQSLYLIPCFTNNPNLQESLGTQYKQRILLSLFPLTNVDKNHLSTSPTNFYSMEQLAVLILKWLVSQIYETLGSTVTKTPSSLVKFLSSINTDGYLKIESNNVTIIKPSLAIKPRLLEFNQKNGSDISINQAINRIIEAVEGFAKLLYCPCCGANTADDQWISRDDNCFSIKSTSCNHKWEVNRKVSGCKVLKVAPINILNIDMSGNFERSGRYSFTVNI